MSNDTSPLTPDPSPLTLFDPMTADFEELAGHIDDIADDDRVWPKSLAELVDFLVDDWKEQGADDEDALAYARRTVLKISYCWGGRVRYVPKDDKLRVALRDSQIWQQFCASRSRRSIPEIAEQHGLSDAQVYSIIKQQKKLTIARRQGDLFTDSEIK